MPTWSEYKSIARQRGALALELFAVESTAAAAPERLQEILPRHLAYQKALEAAGKLFLAGPLSDPSGTGMSGGGLMIYRAPSIADARALAEADPMHAEGGRTFEIRSWLVNEGSLSFQAQLSSQKILIS